MNYSSGGNVSMTVRYRDTFSTAVAKNVLVFTLSLIINYVNGTLLHIFKKHQILYMNPRYILYIHLVVNDMMQLTVAIALFVLSYIFYTLNVSFCCLLVSIASLTTVNTPLNLASMAIECYIAICYPLHHAEFCTVKRTHILISLIWAIGAITILPDLLFKLATEPLETFYSRIFCEKDTVFHNSWIIKKRDVSYILLMVLVWLIIFYTYFHILFAATAAATNAKKARNTILLHGFQLLLCMLTYIAPVLRQFLQRMYPAHYVNLIFVLYIFVQILPRLVSSIVYGLRDQIFLRYLKNHLLCTVHYGHRPPCSLQDMPQSPACLTGFNSQATCSYLGEEDQQLPPEMSGALMGTGATGQAGLGTIPQPHYDKARGKEVQAGVEEERTSKIVGIRQQGAWTSGFADRSLCKVYTLLSITGDAKRKAIKSSMEAALRA
ncbi:odorant receptor 131-2-like [Lampris incognitus]|uniref:odorant receptor 131-2-like n=1 Tax=Lampris incognitus TaxID=2546036 RepID=UPI0024B4BB4C|nr:odorant receptor 131-2-like [Lampris incognitus]